MVGILDIFAIKIGGFVPIVCLVVFLGKLTLGESRCGKLCVELFEFLDRELGIDAEVRVGIFDVAFGVLGVERDGLLLLGCGATEVLGVIFYVAFENVDCGLFQV